MLSLSDGSEDVYVLADVDCSEGEEADAAEVCVCFWCVVETNEEAGEVCGAELVCDRVDSVLNAELVEVAGGGAMGSVGSVGSTFLTVGAGLGLEKRGLRLSSAVVGVIGGSASATMGRAKSAIRSIWFLIFVKMRVGKMGRPLSYRHCS